MKRPAYFIIQFLWSLILATIIWFGFMNTASVDGDNRIAGVILIGGAVLYLLLTVAYVILGVKKTEQFGVGSAIIAVLVNIFTLIVGFFLASGLTNLFIRLLGA